MFVWRVSSSLSIDSFCVFNPINIDPHCWNDQQKCFFKRNKPTNNQHAYRKLSHCVVLLPYFWASGWSPCRLQEEEPQLGPSCPLIWQRDRKCVCERPRFSLRWDEHATAPDLCHPPRCHLVAGVEQRESQGQRQAGTCRAIKSTHRNSKRGFAKSEVEVKATQFGAVTLGLCHATLITVSCSVQASWSKLQFTKRMCFFFLAMYFYCNFGIQLSLHHPLL